MSVALVHNFHTQTSAVENVCPGVEHTTLTIDDGLVEVEAVQVERHRGNTKSGEPDANNRPCCEEEVQRAGVVEGSVLEDQATEVTVSGDDVVGLFFYFGVLKLRAISSGGSNLGDSGLLWRSTEPLLS